MNHLPKITVITIAFNEVDNIEHTLQSVINQTYPNVEYIVVDGGSNDGTVEVIQKYASSITRWVSEKDKGIYDAMNKGIKWANGDWVSFMNAGDWFIDEKVIEQVIRASPKEADMIYGSHEVRHKHLVKHKSPKPVSSLWKYMVFSHQTLFARASLLKENPFDLSKGSSADFYFIYQAYLNHAIFHNTGLKIASFASGGLSDEKVIQSYKQTWKIVREYDTRLIVHLFHIALIGKQYVIVALRKLLPVRVFEALMYLKNKLQSKAVTKH